jgi:hypothetical protein
LRGHSFTLSEETWNHCLTPENEGKIFFAGSDERALPFEVELPEANTLTIHIMAAFAEHEASLTA